MPLPYIASGRAQPNSSVYTLCKKSGDPWSERSSQSIAVGGVVHTHESRSLPSGSKHFYSFAPCYFSYSPAKNHTRLCKTTRIFYFFLFLFLLPFSPKGSVSSQIPFRAIATTLSARGLPECINRRRYCRGTRVGRPVSLDVTDSPSCYITFFPSAGVDN